MQLVGLGNIKILTDYARKRYIPLKTMGNSPKALNFN